MVVEFVVAGAGSLTAGLAGAGAGAREPTWVGGGVGLARGERFVVDVGGGAGAVTVVGGFAGLVAFEPPRSPRSERSVRGLRMRVAGKAVWSVVELGVGDGLTSRWFEAGGVATRAEGKNGALLPGNGRIPVGTPRLVDVVPCAAETAGAVAGAGA